jgi:hypothetical protein
MYQADPYSSGGAYVNMEEGQERVKASFRNKRGFI